jgi:hypothetical protein
MKNVLIYNLNIAGQLRALPGQCYRELDRLCGHLSRAGQTLWPSVGLCRALYRPGPVCGLCDAVTRCGTLWSSVQSCQANPCFADEGFHVEELAAEDIVN